MQVSHWKICVREKEKRRKKNEEEEQYLQNTRHLLEASVEITRVKRRRASTFEKQGASRVKKKNNKSKKTWGEREKKKKKKRVTRRKGNERKKKRSKVSSWTNKRCLASVTARPSCRKQRQYFKCPLRWAQISTPLRQKNQLAK